MLGLIIKSIRPRQWVKNLVVFGALMFVPGAVKYPECWLYAASAFIAFCLLAGGIYLVNDIIDKPRDILHPRKKQRPIASGKLSATTAIVWAILCTGIGLSICFWIDSVADKPVFPETFHWPYGLAMTGVAYVLLMLLYSSFLKNEIILDVLILSIGFVLRAAAGGFALDVRISPWLLATTLFISLFLALGKRRGEIIELESAAGSHRDVLTKYSVRLIDSLLIVCATANIMSYSLYTFLHDLSNGVGVSSPTERGPGSSPDGLALQLMFTVPFVIYGIFRYLHLVFHLDLGSSPDEVITRDSRLMICVGLWVMTVLFMLSLR